MLSALCPCATFPPQPPRSQYRVVLGSQGKVQGDLLEEMEGPAEPRVRVGWGAPAPLHAQNGPQDNSQRAPPALPRARCVTLNRVLEAHALVSSAVTWGDSGACHGEQTANQGTSTRL